MNATSDHAHIEAAAPGGERTAIEGAVSLPVNLLRPNPFNRKRYDATKFEQLVDSVKKHGVIQPIIARAIEGAAAGQPLYEIVAGERRWRAATSAGLATIPSLLKVLTDLELLALLLTENAEREEMNALDEAECLERMLQRGDRLQGYATVDELAARVGRSRAYVFQRLKLLTLCEEARLALLEGDIEASHALIIARIPAAEDQKKATKDIVNGWGGTRMSVRDAQEYVHRTFMLALDRAAFKITDATLVPEAGSCRECPKRTGSNPDLFQDVQKGDTCTDGACFKRKEEAHQAAIVARAQEKGQTVITGAAAKKVKPQAHGSLKGYLELDVTHYQLGGQPLRKMLGKEGLKGLEVSLLQDPHGPGVVEVVPEEAALAALKAAGKIKTSQMPSTSASQREADRKAKAEGAYRAELARQVVEAAGTDAALASGVPEAFAHEVALLLWNRLENDACKRIERLMGWSPIPGSSYEDSHRAAVDKRLRELAPESFRRYIVACVVAGDMHVNTYSGVKPERLHRAATALGVDAAQVRKSLAAEKRVTPDATAAKRAKAKAAALTPETALANALKTAKPAAPKGVRYRHPETGSTWSGKGLQPAWVRAALQTGHTMRSLSVEHQAADAQAAAEPALQ